MATLRQRLVASKLVENGGNVSKTMVAAGYSKATAKTPSKLTNSKSWQKLMDKYLPDNKLLNVHKELLENPDWHARDAGLDKAYRIKGRLAISSQSERDTVSQEVREVIFRVRKILPDSNV